MNWLKKILHLLVAYKYAFVTFVFWSTFSFFYVYSFTPRHHISYYYDIIKNQETVESDFEVTQEEKDSVLKCTKKAERKPGQSSEDCLREFYTFYTTQHGPEKGFEHLSAMQKEFPNLLPGCHYISHGMGHGTLRRVGGDVDTAFGIMSNNNYFKNVATCGNGYFHGVIEEFAKNIYTKEGFIEKLTPVCKKNTNNCHHGVGHALVTQFGFDKSAIDDALYVCDKISDKSRDRFGCYTGVFMEVNQLNPYVATVRGGVLKYNLCDQYTNLYKTACYLEQSSMYESFTEDRKNYSQNMAYCKQIQTDLERMSCVKLFAIRAIRMVRYEDVGEMCSQTSTASERVICTAIMANRTGGSIDKTQKSPLYHQAVKDVCNTLPVSLSPYCTTTVFEYPGRLFYVSESDLSLPYLTWRSFKNFFW